MAAPGNRLSILLLVLASALMPACQSVTTRQPSSYIASYQDFPPKPAQFQVCHDVGCQELTIVSLEAGDWQRLRQLFTPQAQSAAAEREQIRRAIALFERITGPLAKTHNDMSRNDMGPQLSDRQLDCVAETVNTTTYLLLFQQQGWLKWHQVGFPQHRGLFSLLGPHNTAVIIEKASGQRYVVDSWFHNNGALPEIVSSELWAAGYDPAETKWSNQQ